MIAHAASNLSDAFAMFRPARASARIKPATLLHARNALADAPITAREFDAIAADILSRMAQGAQSVIVTMRDAAGQVIGAIIASDALAYDATMPRVAIYPFASRS